MDPKIWTTSQRGFPFNISMNTIVTICLVTPLAFALCTLRLSDEHIWKLYLPIILISIAAYYMTDSLIEQFKSSLEKAGLFGKDLNKAGVKE